MVDLVGTCPKDFWEEWIAEGDAAVCFALIGQMFGLAAIGGLTAGDYGALGGGFAGFFILLWITCWFMMS